MPVAEKVRVTDHTEPRTLTGRILNGTYELKECLAEGAMGMVYRAMRLSDGVPVAIKVIKAKFNRDEETQLRFRREGRATLGLRHPNVVQVHEFGMTQDCMRYLVMELLEGFTLEAHMAINRISPADAAHIVAQISFGLEAVHIRGLIHRDLKPENIWICRSEGDEPTRRVKLLDFGLVRPRNRGKFQTAPGLVVGTVMYMAPEQILGRTIGSYTDVYALGILLYELFAGAHPFQRAHIKQMMEQHVSVNPKPLNRVVRWRVPNRLETLLSACLSKDPTLRPRSVGDVGLELLGMLDELPT